MIKYGRITTPSVIALSTAERAARRLAEGKEDEAPKRNKPGRPKGTKPKKRKTPELPGKDLVVPENRMLRTYLTKG